MVDGPKEIFDQEQQSKEREPGRNYSKEFKDFVKPGVGEVEPANKKNSDDIEIAKARASIKVGGGYQAVKPHEEILADQHHQETIENSRVRNSRPEKKGHSRTRVRSSLGTKISAGLIAFSGILGIVKAEDRQEEVDKIKDTENAARVKTMDQNKMSQQIEYDENGNVKTTEVSDGTKYEVKQ